MKIKMTKMRWVVGTILLLIIGFITFIMIIAKPYKLAKIEYVKGNYDKAIYFYDIAIKNANEKKDIRKVVELNRGLGLAYVKKGDIKKAKEYVNKALKIDLKLYGENNLNTVWDYFNLASFDYTKNKDNPDKVISDVMQILEKAYKIKTKNEEYYYFIANCYSNISVVYGDKKEYGKAIEYAQKASEINIKKFKGQDINIYNNLASLYATTNNYEKALYYYSEALSVAKKYNMTNYQMLRDIEMNMEATNEKLTYRNQMLIDIKKNLTKTVKLTKNNEK